GFDVSPPQATSLPTTEVGESADDDAVAESARADLAETKNEPGAGAKATLKTLADVLHDYQIATTANARAELVRALRGNSSFALALRTDSADVKQARLRGVAFSWAPHQGWFVPLPLDSAKAATILSELRPVLEDEGIGQIGHDLKFIMGALKWKGIGLKGKLFDVLPAHRPIEPDQRHSLGFLSEPFLGYPPASADAAPAGQVEMDLGDAQPSRDAEYATEAAD